MKTRLENILTGCKIAIGDSEYAIDTYVSTCFVNLFLVVSDVVFEKHSAAHAKFDDTKFKYF